MAEFQILKDNKWLGEYKEPLIKRHNNFKKALETINEKYGSIDDYTQSYLLYGLHHRENAIYYKEWALKAKTIHLVGEFNNWNASDHETKCSRDNNGRFNICLPDSEDGTPRIQHNSKVGCILELADGTQLSRIPAWINCTYQNPENFNLDSIFWNQPAPFELRVSR